MIPLASCSGEKKTKSEAKTAAVKHSGDFPDPAEDNFTEFNSETGLRMNMTLNTFTTAFNEMNTELGGKDFPYKKWKKKGKSSQNGLDYVYYYLKKGSITLTATVEKESLYLINIGCGSSAEYYTEKTKNKNKLLKLSAIMAAVAGGYEAQHVPFFTNVFTAAIEQKDRCLWYNNWIYLYEKTKKTRLFRVMPATSETAVEWNIENYESYVKKVGSKN